MNLLPLKARIYIIFISIAGIGIALYFALQAVEQPHLWFGVLAITIAVTVLDVMPIKPYGSNVEMTISDVVKFAAVLMFPPAVPILATFLGTVIGELVSKRHWVKKVFNISIMTITIVVVSAIYSFIVQSQFNLLGSLQNVIALVLAGLADFAVNSILVASVISLADEIPLKYVWLQNYPRVVLHDLTTIPLGVFVAILWQFSPLAIVFVILPLAIVRHSYQTANYLQRQTEDALKALMRVIDERDNVTSDHSERVAELARSISRLLELPPAEIEIIVPAASLHDLGKVGMENNILFKPGVLTVEERHRAQRHATIGGELLSKFPLFEKGAILVRHHHERYDGTGYPDGLKGDDIPIGARVLAVADSFEAMTEDRPYRKAMTQDEAIAELVRCSGTQYDPRVVQALLQALGKNTPLVAETLRTSALPTGA